MHDFLNKYRKNLFIVIIVAFIVYFYIISKHDMSLFMKQLNQINLLWLFLALALVFLRWLIDSRIFNLFIKLYNKKFSLWKTFKLILATQFFNNITPFASGGQPFQIYYLSKTSTKSSDSISVTMLNYIVFQIATIVIGAFFLIIKYSYFKDELDDFSVLILIGFACTLFITLLLGALSISKRLNHFLFVSILGKIGNWRILKKVDIEKIRQSLIEFIHEFSSESKILLSKKLLMFRTIFLNFIKIIISYSIPIFIFLSVGENVEGNIINIIALSSFVVMFIAYIPVPGSSGAAEYVFSILFSILFKDTIILTLVLWRLLTYYLGLVVGFISLVNLDFSNTKSVVDRDLNDEGNELNYSI